MKKRIFNVCFVVISLVFLGLFYLYLHKTGLTNGCLIYNFTGLKCPSCGGTRMVIYLLRLDFASAFYYNKGLFITLPLFLYIAITLAANYIKSGKFLATKKVTNSLCVTFLILFIYTLIRNITNVF